MSVNITVARDRLDASWSEASMALPLEPQSATPTARPQSPICRGRAGSRKPSYPDLQGLSAIHDDPQGTRQRVPHVAYLA